ncbi:MAG: ATPase [Bacillota bacterium]
MQKGRTRNVFPGGNTSRGFFSYYDYIISAEDANRVFILKGGPGVGKSTFMRKIADEMTGRGYDAELMHCSSDNESLDGVVIPQIGVALMDGTAPHVIDPANPGIIDEIINMGDCWDDVSMRKNREKAIRIKNEISGYFQAAYGYLKAASHVYDNSAAIYGSAMDRDSCRIVAEELVQSLFDGIMPARRSGRQRCLFASAITPDGLKNFIDELMATNSVYLLLGFPGAGTEIVLEKIKEAALARGFCTEAFYCAFNPGKLEHLIVPGLNAAFSTVNKYHKTDACALKTVDFAAMLDERIIEKRRAEIDYNRHIFDELLDKAVGMIHNAKLLHDELEALYIPCMDFDAVNKKWEAAMEKILKLADEGTMAIRMR